MQCFAPRLGKQGCRLSFRVFRVFRGSAFCMNTAQERRDGPSHPGAARRLPASVPPARSLAKEYLAGNQAGKQGAHF